MPKARVSVSEVTSLSRSAIGRASGKMSRLLGGLTAIRATGQFIRRQLWAWPLIAAIVLGGVGWWIARTVEDAMRKQRADELTTILNADVAALKVWMADHQRTATLIAGDEQLRPAVRELLELGAKPGSTRPLLQAKAQETLRKRFERRWREHGYLGFFLISPKGLVLAADGDAPVGTLMDGEREDFFGFILEGHSSVSRPYRSPLLLADSKGALRANLPTMLAGAPVFNETDSVIAALGLRIRPEDQFTRILQVAQSGATGETYAFDRDGLFLSQSRFDEQLKQIGLLPDLDDSRSVLVLQTRDPGSNLVAGERAKVRRADQPLTRAAADAVTGGRGYDVDGYRDYRGVPVVGAWTWLPEYDFGVASEMDVEESFRPVFILRIIFVVVMGLLALGAVAMFVGMIFLAKQNSALQQAVLQAKQLGQYTLEKKLGSGGMGTVYQARHAMLRRPTAVKLLDTENISDAAVARFEREVQLTSGLTHPNTVAIFDYGRTPEGIFYYAMEYLEGTNLDNLVTRFGPLPEARVVYLLRQVCGSLAEAHAASLVHRDIKPANVFLTCRGGLYDYVKVLDFGLVKPVAGTDTANLTNTNLITGTPLYLSPEAVNRPDLVDARSDVYAIGALAYFLLTGAPVFSGTSPMDICMKHVQTPPEPPSTRLGKQISPHLEGLILRCLEKSQSKRPADALGLLRELDTYDGAPWSPEDARAWWTAMGARVAEAGAQTVTSLRSPTQPPPPDGDKTIAMKSNRMGR